MKPHILEPALVAFPQTLAKGSLVLLPATATESPLILRFQYNPETITRTRTGNWESRKTGQDGKKSAAQDRAMDAFKGGGLFAKSETIALKLVFDATEAMIDPDVDESMKMLGVIPQLGLLERMGISEPPGKEEQKKKDTKLNAVVPKQLLLFLGSRTFPVIVTNMTINEKRFNTSLTPIRAEVDLQLQLMEASEISGQPAVALAYTQLVELRTEAAKTGSSKDQAILDFIKGAMDAPAGGKP